MYSPTSNLGFLSLLFGSTIPLPFVLFSSFFLVLMKEKSEFQLNVKVFQTKLTIQYLKKYSQRDHCTEIVSTIQLKDENLIFRTSIQNIYRIYICTTVLYRWIDCIILLYCVAVLYRCFVEFKEFTQITKQNYLQKFYQKFHKRGHCFLS